MKRIFILGAIVCSAISGFAQTDTAAKPKTDTIKIGGMVIIREGGGKDEKNQEKKSFTITGQRHSDKPANISTNWWIFDLGFSNYSDKSNYAALTPTTVAPGITKESMKLRAGKSRNVSLWIFTQKVNMIKHVVNLKYGVGLELNNYHFDNEAIQFNKTNPVITEGFATRSLKKNKLAADYLTVPVMLNFDFTPNRHGKHFGMSAGVSAGYLYSSRQKIKEDGDVDKTKDDFGLRNFKLSYIGEISLGPVRIYGSYAFKSMFENGLDITPYNVGFRFSNW